MDKIKCIKCPDCLNYMKVCVNDLGEERGRCHRCHAFVIAKQSDKERLIRIIRQ